MATKWTSPVWRMPENSNQSKLDNYSLHFDGTEFINVGVAPELDLTSALSISAWVTFDDFIGTGSIFENIPSNGAADGYKIFRWDNELKFQVEGTAIVYNTQTGGTIAQMVANTWYHIMCTWDGSTIKMYINNTEVASGSVSSVNYSSTLVMIGKNQPYSGTWEGRISNISVFDYALSSSQKLYLYNSGTPQNPMAIAGPTPIAYYPLGQSATGDDNTLTTPNESDNGDTVFDFNQAEQSVDIGNDFENYTEMTLSTWVNFNNFSGYQYVFSTAAPNLGAGTQLSIAATPSAGVIYSYDGANLNLTGVSVVLNTWNHIVITQTGTIRKVFINGQQAGSNITTSNLNLNSGTSFIGKYHTSGYSANAKISNVQVWNTSLIHSEVATLYNSGRPYTGTQPQAANLKGWWKMNIDNSSYVDTITDWLIPSSANPTPLANSCYRFRNNGGGKFGNSSSIGKSSETSFTMSYWLNKLDNSDRYPMGINGSFYSDNGYIRVRMTSSSILLYHNKNASSGGSAVISIANAGISYKRWHHYLWTYSSSSWKLFIDGVDKTSNLTNTNIPDTMPVGGSSANAIGSYWAPPTNNTGNTSDLNGFMSNIALWNSDKSSNYLDIYNSGTPGDISSLSPNNWWKLETDTLDSGSSGNDLTTNGLTWIPAQKTNNLAVTTGAMGESSGMTTANLVTSDLQRSLLYSSYSMDFDSASNQWIELTGSQSLFNSLTAFSVSLWLNPSATQAAYTSPFSFKSASTQYLKLNFGATPSNNQLEIAFRNSATATATSSVNSIPLNTWTNVIVVFDASSSLSLYVNGSLDGQDTTSLPTSAVQSTNIYIGTDAGSTDARDFNGKISNVSIFNKALSENDILTIYNGGAPNDISSLSPVGWWSLSGDSYFATNWICPDLSTNSNNGTSNNMDVTDLVGNAPGSTSNGTGTSMAIPTNLQGDAPNSDKNAISINMVATNRVSGSGNVP